MKPPAVWISRPRRRALPLARALIKHRLTPFLMPAMRIVAVEKSAAVKQFLNRPHDFDLAVFVSEEAARRCHPLLSAAAKTPLPALAIGAATLTALRMIPALTASDETAGASDSLLRLPCLRAAQIDGKKIAVIGGLSGDNPHSLSPQLCAALTARHARVSPLAMYRRLPPLPHNKVTQQPAAGILRAAVAYSGDTAANMLAMTAPDNAWLKNLPLFVTHPQIAAAAQKIGYQTPQLAPAATAAMAARIARQLMA